MQSILIAILQRSRQWLQPKRLAVVEACLIGLVAGLAAVLLKQGVGWLGGWRVQISHGLYSAIALPAIGLIGGLIAGWSIERFAPEASGSGIPQVKAALSRVDIALNLRVAIVKLFGTTLTLGAGFALGRQGPTVQICSALAAQLSQWIPTSPDYQRQLIAAGAAAGLAAGFNAPIAGVLFVIEELLQDVSSLTLGTAILASFIGSVVSRILGGQSLNLDINAMATKTSFFAYEIPFFLLLGVLVGLFAALFNYGAVQGVKWSRKMQIGLPWRIGLAGCVSGLAMALLPPAFRDSSGLQEFLTVGGASWQFIAGAFIVRFFLTLVACSAETPGGLFAPSLILGAALGSLVGHFEHAMLGMGQTTTYALAGMGAFFGAVAKVPITAIVIVFEIATNFNLVLPLMIVSVTAYLVAEKLVPGSLYSHLLELKGIRLEQKVDADGVWAKLTAADVMQQRVETLTCHMTLDEAIEAFAHSHHRGFPVLKGSKLVGIVTQTDLASAKESQFAGTTRIDRIMTPHPIAVRPTDTLSDVLYLLNRYKLSRLPVTEGIDLRGIITRSDIIRAESDCLTGKTKQVGPRPEPSYVVYQTRAPATGEGRILVTLHNPYTAPTLLEFAAAIARDRNYEVECLHVISVSRDCPPSEAKVNTTASRRLMHRTQQLSRTWQIPIHTQIRVAHDNAQAILETIKERRIDVTLMGWKGNTFTPGRIFGDVTDTVIRQAPCSVVLVKLASQEFLEVDNSHPTGDRSQKKGNPPPKHSKLAIDRWLVPIAGGPNAQQAIKLLPGLVSLGDRPEIRLCQVYQKADIQHDRSVLEEDVSYLKQHLDDRVGDRIFASAVCSSSVPEAVLDLARTYRSEAIMLGASRESLFHQTVKGNIPEAIALKSNCTVIVVRDAVRD